MVTALLLGELIEQFANLFPEIGDGSFGGLSQERFELGEHLLDRV
jgi:hypothetical protein